MISWSPQSNLIAEVLLLFQLDGRGEEVFPRLIDPRSQPVRRGAGSRDPNQTVFGDRSIAQCEGTSHSHGTEGVWASLWGLSQLWGQKSKIKELVGLAPSGDSEGESLP